MAFSDHKVSDHAEVRGPRIQGLLDRLPEADAQALLALFRDTAISVAKLRRIIADEAPSYPDLDPGWFHPAEETVRKYAVKERKSSVNGL